MESIKVVAIDPGVTTGIAIHSVMPDRVSPEWVTLELGPDDHHEALYQLLNNHHPTVLVYERFDYRIIQNRGVDMPGVVLTSVEYIGIIKLWHWRNEHVELVSQGSEVSSQKKGFWNDNRLKALGRYQAPMGRQHMNDATRHALNFIVFKLGRKDYLDALKP